MIIFSFFPFLIPVSHHHQQQPQRAHNGYGNEKHTKPAHERVVEADARNPRHHCPKQEYDNEPAQKFFFIHDYLLLDYSHANLDTKFIISKFILINIF